MESTAATWRARIVDAPGPRMQARFDRWLGESPVHADAYERVRCAEDWARGFAGAPEILMLRKETLARTSTPRPPWMLPIAASILVMLASAALVGRGLIERDAPAQDSASPASIAAAKLYRTERGQRATLTLSDGSRVVLNTATHIRVAYGPHERRLLLDRGQAWFDVAKDPDRRFVVAAGGREIIAHGTSFDVRVDRGRLEVMLVEGRVTVDQPRQDKPSEAAPSVALAPSQLLVATADRVAVQRVPDALPIQSWRSGLLIFRDQRLGDAVAEFNRYTRQPMTLANAATGDIRISGAFRSDDSKAFLGALEAGFAVKSEEVGGRVRLTRD